MAAPPPIQSLNLNLVPGLSLAIELTRFGTNRRASPCNVEALGGMFKAFPMIAVRCCSRTTASSVAPGYTFEPIGGSHEEQREPKLRPNLGDEGVETAHDAASRSAASFAFVRFCASAREAQRIPAEDGRRSAGAVLGD